jgi:hypothetical protein
MMRIPTSLILVIFILTSCTSTTRSVSFDLDQAEVQLEEKVGGTWEKESTNPDIGPMLVPKDLPAPLKAGFFGVVAFGQDETGKKKMERYMSTCSAPLYILGANQHCTVITWLPRDNTVSRKVFDVLKLSPPRIISPSERMVNRKKQERTAEPTDALDKQ